MRVECSKAANRLGGDDQRVSLIAVRGLLPAQRAVNQSVRWPSPAREPGDRFAERPRGGLRGWMVGCNVRLKLDFAAARRPASCFLAGVSVQVARQIVCHGAPRRTRGGGYVGAERIGLRIAIVSRDGLTDARPDPDNEIQG